MKRTLTFVLAVLVISNNLNAQTLKDRLAKADKIYIAPVQSTFYFLLDRSSPPKPFRDIVSKGKGQGGLAPAWVKEYGAYWEANKGKYFFQNKNSYNSGDTICTIGTFLPDQLSKDWYTIVNNVSREVVDEINAKMIAQCEQMFGRKVEVWPEGKFMSDKAWEYYDEKEVECSFYILAEITGTQNIILNIDITKDKNATIKKSVGATGSSVGNYIRFTLFEKTKPGKPGKKVASNYETIFETLGEKDFPLDGESPKDLTGFDSENAIKFSKGAVAAGKSYSDEMLKSLADIFPKSIEGFFKKVEKELNK